jgi:hypothetical protein
MLRSWHAFSGCGAALHVAAMVVFCAAGSADASCGDYLLHPAGGAEPAERLHAEQPETGEHPSPVCRDGSCRSELPITPSNAPKLKPFTESANLRPECRRPGDSASSLADLGVLLPTATFVEQPLRPPRG